MDTDFLQDPWFEYSAHKLYKVKGCHTPSGASAGAHLHFIGLEPVDGLELWVCNVWRVWCQTRKLHGDRDDGNTTVMGLNNVTNTTVIVGMGTAFTVVQWEQWQSLQ